MGKVSTAVQIKRYVFDCIFPRHCLSCKADMHKSADALYVCVSCFSRVSLTSKVACAFCAAPVIDGRTCPFCRKDHALDRLFVAADYAEPVVERLAKAVKYRFAFEATHDIARLMLRHIAEKKIGRLLTPVAVVMPVPLHPRRLRWRGFNQSELIARDIAEALQIPFSVNVLARIRHKKPQADIKDRAARIENARGLFAINPNLAVKPLKAVSPLQSLQGQTVLLVDDLSTTGSTLDACARALKGAGAAEVFALVFARG